MSVGWHVECVILISTFVTYVVIYNDVLLTVQVGTWNRVTRPAYSLRYSCH